MLLNRTTDAFAPSSSGSFRRPGFFNFKRLLEAQTDMLLGQGIVLHCSAAVLGGEALLLTSPSGGGKSTAAGLLSGLGYRIIGSDNVLITRNSLGEPCAYPTLNFTYETGKRPDPAPIGGLCILEKSDQPMKIDVESGYALFRLIRDRSMMLYGDMPFRTLKTVRATLGEYLDDIPACILAFSRHEFPVGLLETSAER